jgi:hypothetical protein
MGFYYSQLAKLENGFDSLSDKEPKYFFFFLTLRNQTIAFGSRVRGKHSI